MIRLGRLIQNNLFGRLRSVTIIVLVLCLLGVIKGHFWTRSRSKVHAQFSYGKRERKCNSVPGV